MDVVVGRDVEVVRVRAVLEEPRACVVVAAVQRLMGAWKAILAFFVVVS